MKMSSILDYMNNDFKICKNYRIWLVVPIVVILVAIALIVGLGETLPGGYTDAIGIGIDFEGGTKLTVNLTDIDVQAGENYDAYANSLENQVEGFGVNVSYVQKTVSDTNGAVSVQLRYKNISNDSAEISALNTQIIDSIKSTYAEASEKDQDFITWEMVSATAAKNLLSSAAIAVCVSVALILIYIIFRFTFVSGLAAILALIHDVLIMFCLTVFCRNIAINTAYVAAMVTIVSYSINNTIVIFDRVRELMRPMKGQKNINYEAIGDAAVKATMRRSVFTTVTTVATVFFLAVLGGASMQEFCVPIILGLVAGFYSSIFIATPIWAQMSYAWDKIVDKYKKKDSVTYDDVEEDLTVLKPAKVKDEDDTVETFAQDVKVKQQKQKQNTTYKYSKKNTTFKKKK